MAQVPTIQYNNIVPKVFAVGTGPDTGPKTGLISPADISDMETLQGSWGLYHKGTKFATVYDLVLINNKYVVKEIAGYVVAMINAAKSAGINLRLTSGFRTMQEQSDLFTMKTDTSPAAKPGFGSHQTGIAVDFNVYDHNGKVYEWLVKNAYRFGFIRTVPNERWHWEYWGSWSGQKRPQWAGGRGGTNILKHKRMSMFSKVPRIHACGDGKTGGSLIMYESGWWTSNGATGEHTDKATLGRTNSWIGFANAFLPQKFDDEEASWDQRKF